jgi:hypothetical protein
MWTLWRLNSAQTRAYVIWLGDIHRKGLRHTLYSGRIGTEIDVQIWLLWEGINIILMTHFGFIITAHHVLITIISV